MSKETLIVDLEAYQAEQESLRGARTHKAIVISPLSDHTENCHSTSRHMKTTGGYVDSTFITGSHCL